MLIKMLCRLPSSKFALSPLIPLIIIIIIQLDYMYPSSDKETRTERKNKKGKGRREGSWKHMIAIGCAPNCRSTLIHSHHHPMMYNTITNQLAVTDINNHQADELCTTVQKDFIASHPGGIRNTISSKGKTMKSKNQKQRR